MRMRYDPQVDIVYVALSNAKVLEFEEVHPGIVFDFDPQGRIVGIEIYDARDRVAPDALSPLRAAE